ncbi:MAG TPA: PA domain-containing protein [Pyrinomonadaceae bacterium]
MNKSTYLRLHTWLLILVVAAFASSTAYGNATITIQNGDSPGVGFNDATAAAPVGGNNGTTVGQQRLNAFTFAAGVWGATLNSNQTIVIRANWAAQSCTPTSGVLGSAGAANIFRDFNNAPFTSTWYSVALANAISNSDLNSSTQEINATFNLSLGTSSCLTTSPWYYGLDNNHGSGIDLVSVLLHEFGHGLGFQTFTSSSTGAPNGGFFSIYDRFLRDDSTNKLWIDMTNSERVASAVNTGNLVWAGPQVVSDVPNVLGTPRLRINSPPGIAGNYTVGTADFGSRISSPGVTADVVRATDAADGNGPTTTDGCSAFTNAAAISGKIAFIDRGTCNFVVKTKNAQNAGAIGVIIGNVSSSSSPTIPPNMSGSDATITIPTVGLAVGDADTIRGQLGGTVNGSIALDPTTIIGADSANRAKMYAPNPLESGSSVSHFDTSLFPNQLMEPNNSADLTHAVTTPQDLTFSLLRDIGWTGVVPPTTTVQLASASVSASEGVGSMSVTVSRTGSTSGASSVDYATSDTSGNNACSTLTGAASAHCDYVQTLGTLTFAAGETSKTILIPIIDDVFAEGNETFTLTLTNAVGATLGTSTSTLTIIENDGSTGTNPIDNANFFVRQHYIDFLNREPDSAGLNFWVNQITSCGSNQTCIDEKRINVSAAFFLSIEFQETGYLVYRTYKTAFGNLTTPPGAPIPIVLTDFLRDTQRIGQGVQVNVGDWQTQLENNKQAYMLAFVQRADFLSQYPNTMTATDFVTQLNIRAGNVLSPAEQTTQINNLGATPSDVTKRSQVLRAVAEDADLKTAEFNKAFVLMQYFGYLRRDPNSFPDVNYDGYNFWLTKLNNFNGNYNAAEMVKSFLVAGEYRQRFGP